jgi:hypothetical protein
MKKELNVGFCVYDGANLRKLVHLQANQLFRHPRLITVLDVE